MQILSTTLVLVGLIGFGLAKFISALRTAHFSPLRKVPGPYYARWTNMILKWNVLAGERAAYIHEMHQKYGHFVRIAPDEVSVSDVPSFQEIHRIGAGYPKADWYLKFQGNEPGLFAMQDFTAHSVRRRLLAQGFSKSTIMAVQDSVRLKVEMAVAKMKRDATEGVGDMLKWWTFMATDVVGELSFGKSFDMLIKEQKDKYIEDLEALMFISGTRAEIEPVLRVAAVFIPKVRDMLGLMPRIQEYGLKAITNHREIITSGQKSNSLFSRLIDPKKNQELTDDQLGREAGNFIIAGSDTTAMSLTYLCWLLLRPENKAAKERLLKEIEDVPKDAPASELEALPYLQGCISEALRLYAAVSATLPRNVPPEGATLGGYYLPPGTIVGTQAHTMHRNPDIYPDPESFKPERWFEPTKLMKDSWCPFGAGGRICIGLHLANLELTLSTFLFFKEMGHTARISDDTTDESMRIKCYFCIFPSGHKCGIVVDGEEQGK